jgi:triosephosphate isomerase
MNGTRESGQQLVRGIISGLGTAVECDVMVCPPFVYLSEVAELIGGVNLLLGAQDVAKEAAGAFTGEISAAMLKDIGCSHVLVGHSERRGLYGENDALVAAKFQAVLAENLSPILCLGETLEEREGDVTKEVIDRQIQAVLDAAGIAAFATSIVAYEPVWAIGTGRTATPDQAQDVHAHIRSRFSSVDAKIGAELRILYGGSVKGSNAVDLFAMDDIDGGLIGGASLDATEFAAICRAAGTG